MNLLDFFELTSEPFANSPDGRFYFESAQHAQVMARLKHVTESMKGLAIVVGDIGTGKTTLARRFMETLSEGEYEAALLVVIHSAITSDWLLTKIAMQLGVEEPAGDKVTLLGQLYGRLREIHESGKRAVVLIDEAQMLRSKEIMEELRGLLNLELPGRKLISFVFFGLPEVEAALRLDPPLQQRVALKMHLQSLPPSSTEDYIKHRLRVAGARVMPFSREAVAAVHQYSRGTPRLINTICDNALLEAFLLKRRAIGDDLIHVVARDLGLAQQAAAAARDALAAGQRLPPRDPLDPRLGSAPRPAPAAATSYAPAVARPAGGPGSTGGPLRPAAAGRPPAPGAPAPARVAPAPSPVATPGARPAAPPAAPRATPPVQQRPAGPAAAPLRQPAPSAQPAAAQPALAPARGSTPGGSKDGGNLLGDLDEFDALLSGLDKP